MGRVRVGAALVDITPPYGVEMAGYGDRKGVAQGIGDPLKAGALAIEAGEELWVLVTSDLAGVVAEMTAEIRKMVSLAAGIDGNRVTVTASHTHSGPQLVNRLTGAEDKALKEITLRKMAGAAIMAVKNLKPGRVGFGVGNLDGLGKNRRTPDGPSDPRVFVIRAEDAAGNLIACVANYSCHPTVLNYKNLLISADYPGYYRQAMEKVLGDGVVVLFANGAAGNISTRWTRREPTFAEAKRMGELLASAALSTLLKIETKDDISLKMATDKIELPTRKLPSKEEAQKTLAELTAKYEELKRSGAPTPVVRTAEVAVQGINATLRLIEAGLPKRIVAEVQCIKLDDFVFVTVPAELFVEYDLALGERFPEFKIHVIGYANDSIGYVPTVEGYDEGGYEVLSSRLDREAGNFLLEGCASLVQKLV